MKLLPVGNYSGLFHQLNIHVLASISKWFGFWVMGILRELEQTYRVVQNLAQQYPIGEND